MMSLARSISPGAGVVVSVGSSRALVGQPRLPIAQGVVNSKRWLVAPSVLSSSSRHLSAAVRAAVGGTGNAGGELGAATLGTASPSPRPTSASMPRRLLREGGFSLCSLDAGVLAGVGGAGAGAGAGARSRTRSWREAAAVACALLASAAVSEVVHTSQGEQYRPFVVDGIANQSIRPAATLDLRTPKAVTKVSAESAESESESTDRADVEEKYGHMMIFSGSANPDLAEEIVHHLGAEVSAASVKKFADGETSVQVLDNVRGADVYIVQPTGPPVNEHLVELLLMISTMRRASAKTITAVVPYFGYKRDIGTPDTSSKRRSSTYVPVSAADVARMLTEMGVDNVICVDLQPPGRGQIEGFFDNVVRVDNLRPSSIAVEHLSKSKLLENPVVIAANESCVELAKDFIAGMRKRRDQHIPFAAVVHAGESRGSDRYVSVPTLSPRERLMLVGDVKGRDALLVDDLIDTGSTAVATVRLLKEGGARRIVLYATHGLFSRDAIDVISRCTDLDEVVVTNTLPLNNDTSMIHAHQVSQLSIAPLLAEAILRLHRRESLQDLRVYDRENFTERYSGQGLE